MTRYAVLQTAISGAQLMETLGEPLERGEFTPTQTVSLKTLPDGQVTVLSPINIQQATLTHRFAANDPRIPAAIKAPTTVSDILRGVHKLAREFRLTPSQRARVANWVSQENMLASRGLLKGETKQWMDQMARKLVADMRLNSVQRKRLGIQNFNPTMQSAPKTAQRPLTRRMGNYNLLKALPTPTFSKVDITKIDTSKLLPEPEYLAPSRPVIAKHRFPDLALTA